MSSIKINMFHLDAQKLGEANKNGDIFSKDPKITNPLKTTFELHPNYFVAHKSYSFVKDGMLKVQICTLTLYNNKAMTTDSITITLTPDIIDTPPFVNGFICYSKKIEEWLNFPNET